MAKSSSKRTPGTSGKPAFRPAKRVGATPAATRKKAERPRKAANPPLLAGGNPQIAKGHGDGPVQAYIAAMAGWKREVGRRIDELIVRTVPGVQKAVKWNSPLFGVEREAGGEAGGQGAGGPGVGSWFLGIHCFAKYVKVAFFRGTSLRPVPPGASKQKEVRYLDIREDDWAIAFDEAQFVSWVKQASELPGERM